jgi:copper transport protein
MIAARRATEPRRRFLLGLTVAGWLVLLVLPSAALAHANLVRVEPGDGAVLSVGPEAVRLLFDRVVVAQPGIRAVRNSGGSVLSGRVRVVGGHELVIPLRRSLGKGGYTILWRVLSDDGHPVAGVTTFAVGVGQSPPQAALRVPSEQRALPGVERWLFLGGILLGFGLSTFRLAMPRVARPPLLALSASLVLTVCGGVALLGDASLSTRFGIVVAAASCLAAVGAVAAVAAAVVPLLASVAWLCGLVLIVAPSAAGHALDPGRSLVEFPLDLLHVAASSVWFGGLASLALAARQGQLREDVVRRFSLLALGAVVVIAATGIARAFAELRSFGQLWETGYGRLLIVKSVLFATLAGFGWQNRYRLIPALARSARRLRRNLHAELVVFLALVGAVALLTQTQPGRDRLSRAATAEIDASTTGVPHAAVVLAQRGLSVELAGAAANAVSSDGTTILWETVPTQESEQTALVERNLETGRTRTLARNVAPLFGLTATRTAIVYATATSPERLVLLDRRSRRQTELTEALAAPFASRGHRIAWAQERNGRQRVIVYDLRHNTTWTAADFPNCVSQPCYRIGSITLAANGVVFDRIAAGSDTSYIIRRAYSAPKPQRTVVKHDPQPDLAPSATGALYYARQGWYRWDFDQQQPQPVTAFAADSYPIAYDGSRWLLLQRHGCADTIVERPTRGRSHAIASPATAQTVTGVRTGICVRVQNMTLSNTRPITTWSIVLRTIHPTGTTSVITIGPGG